MISLEMEGAREFAIARYRWTLEQWRLEIEHDFPLIRAVHDEYPAITIQLLKALPAQEALRIGQLIAKRSHSEAAEFLGDPLSSEDKDRLRMFDEERWNIYNRGYASTRAEAARKTNRSALKKCVREAIEPVLGTDRQVGGGVWDYSTKVGRWTIVTEIEFGGVFVMSYYHAIDDGSESYTYFASNLSIPGELGICPGWSGLSDEEIPAAASGLAFLCRRFLEAAPDLLPK